MTPEPEIKTTIKRVRVTKESPPFEKIETTGILKELPVELINVTNCYSVYNCDKKMSLYTPFIPAMYLANRAEDITDEEWVNNEELINMRYLSLYDDPSEEQFKTLHPFLYPTGQDPIKYRGFLSMMVNNKFHVLSVVLPENLVYQKLYILKNGTIDLKRVVVLVDRELDNTTFYNRRTREIYKKELLPLLESTACDVWKVPLQFIEENCFYGDFRLLSKNLMDRKREKSEMIEAFRKSVYPQPTASEGSGIFRVTQQSGRTSTITIRNDGELADRDPLPW